MLIESSNQQRVVNFLKALWNCYKIFGVEYFGEKCEPFGVEHWYLETRFNNLNTSLEEVLAFWR